MEPLEKHRLFLYGRIGLSVALFIVSMVLASSAILTGNPTSHPFLVGGLLVGSIVVLPRQSVPRSEEARDDASDEELEHFRRIRKWLTWTRLVYLIVGIAVFFGLPELM